MRRAGGLTAQAAAWTGLPEGIAVAVGNVDAHVTAAAAQALEPGRLVAIMGTSTCHVVNGTDAGRGRRHVRRRRRRDQRRQPGATRPGRAASATSSAGSSSTPPPAGVRARTSGSPQLAAEQPVGAHGLVALDWWNGNRSLLVNHDLSGMIVGLTLATRPPDIYRALLESTAYGTRMIIEAFADAGVPVTELVIAGGLTSNALLMQIYADVTAGR